MKQPPSRVRKGRLIPRRDTGRFQQYPLYGAPRGGSAGPSNKETEIAVRILGASGAPAVVLHGRQTLHLGIPTIPAPGASGGCASRGALQTRVAFEKPARPLLADRPWGARAAGRCAPTLAAMGNNARGTRVGARPPKPGKGVLVWPLVPSPRQRQSQCPLDAKQDETAGRHARPRPTRAARQRAPAADQ